MPSATKNFGEIELCGDDLLTIACTDPPAAQALAAALREESAWLEVVAGMDSVVVHFDAAIESGSDALAMATAIVEKGIPPLATEQTLVEIPVHYGGDGGPDFALVCEQTGLTGDELVALHSGDEYRVDLLGFTPGFVYVGGLDEALNVSRLAEPRQHVPAGSVGIADGRTGLYAMPGPGGWPLIGRTSHTLFDASAENPFPISAGMRIRFVAVPSEDDA